MHASDGTPIHLWAVRLLALLWNAFGVFDYLITQNDNAKCPASFAPEQRAWFEGFPARAAAAWAIGMWGALVGSILLLLHNRPAVTAFALSLAGSALCSRWPFSLSPRAGQRHAEACRRWHLRRDLGKRNRAGELCLPPAPVRRTALGSGKARSPGQRTVT
jgi:hypothetical protein